MRFKEALTIFLKGVCMGTADVIPGISGGKVALITGIYERLLHSISKVNFKFIIYFLKGDLKKASENIKNIDFQLFIPLLAGMGLAILLMSNIIHFLLQHFTAVTYAFFFGLILASGALLYKKSGCLSSKNILFSALGFLCAFLFVESTGLNIEPSLPVVFFSGILAICAMILPGISGAFILLFLGQYEYMLFVLKELLLLEILVFCFGAFIGLLFFSRVVTYVLNKYRSLMMFFLIGLMLGALRFPYQNIVSSMDSLLPVLMSSVIGFFFVLILGMRSEKLSEKAKALSVTVKQSKESVQKEEKKLNSAKGYNNG